MSKKKDLPYELVIGVDGSIPVDDVVSVISPIFNSFSVENVIKKPFYGEYWGLRGMFLKNSKKISAHYYYFQFFLNNTEYAKEAIEFIKKSIKRSSSIIKGNVFVAPEVHSKENQTIMMRQTMKKLEESKADENPNQKIIISEEYKRVVKDLMS